MYKINTVYVVMYDHYKIIWNQMDQGQTTDSYTLINRIFATREEAEKYIAELRDEYRNGNLCRRNELTMDIWTPDMYRLGYILERSAGTCIEQRISYELQERVLD